MEITDYILTSREVDTAEDTLREAARSGHWQGAALALQAYHEAKRISLPGGDWRVTVLDSLDPASTHTLAVVGFNAIGPVVLDCDGGLTDLDLYVRLFGPAPYYPSGHRFFEVWNTNLTDEAAIIAQLVERGQDGVA